ncbi:putative fluoride ion transporter CrcB 2 [Lactobacillus nasalidis]|uniref:Fluoride-specific ion channel FluC n=1 Tax=Lactobacillus nasalidis TaxID=2797258 RepID=A0ABQ3W289_9LACO|nr:fluoride efflux transporter CrcB [Lactobacillus nasalidis]GHV97934.1 putative fluoride ion transporter CrcB 2 [Lactobacillus nasalidis]GHV99142.1 putative fluoride ion transporter CrcB 2 [Lactobacillus nasalidis]GHW00363.1 putative fluoride ion transporter CrcB 2 [Lactobacillus nasalidis]
MIFAVGFGASLGALARFGLTNYGKKHWMRQTAFPWPTLVINLSGAFLLGLVFALNLPAFVYAFLGTGVLGGYTTFSTLNTEMLSLADSGKKRLLKRYLLASYLGGICLLTAGYYLGTVL